MPALVSALKSVDLPTFGNPTMPHFSAMGNLGDPPEVAQRWDYRKPAQAERHGPDRDAHCTVTSLYAPGGLCSFDFHQPTREWR